MLRYLLLLLFLLPCVAQCQVFKCLNAGRVSYSAQPCFSGAPHLATSNDSEISREHDSVRVVRGANGGYNLSGTVNGQAASFLIDTGAGFTTLSGELANRLGMHSCQPVGIADTAGGQANVCRMTLSSLSVAGFNFSNIVVGIIPTMTGPSLIGNDLLSKLKMSQESGVITLSH